MSAEITPCAAGDLHREHPVTSPFETPVVATPMFSSYAPTR